MRKKIIYALLVATLIASGCSVETSGTDKVDGDEVSTIVTAEPTATTEPTSEQTADSTPEAVAEPTKAVEAPAETGKEDSDGSAVSIVLGEYKGIELNRVSQEAVDEEIAQIIEEMSYLNPVNRAAVLGDTVSITYVGKIDDVAFEGGSTGDNATDLELGSHKYIDTFEEQLVGHSAGDEVKVVVTFPENYGKEEYANKEAVFEVKIHEVKELYVPELTDQLVREVMGLENVAAYRAQVEAELNEAEWESAIVRALVSGSTLTGVPTEELTEYSDSVYNNVYNRAEYVSQLYGIPTETVLYLIYGMDETSLRAYADNCAQLVVSLRYLAAEVARVESIVVTDDDVIDYAEANYEELGYESAVEFYNAYKDEIKENMLTDKVIEFLRENAVILPAEN